MLIKGAIPIPPAKNTTSSCTCWLNTKPPNGPLTAILSPFFKRCNAEVYRPLTRILNCRICWLVGEEVIEKHLMTVGRSLSRKPTAAYCPGWNKRGVFSALHSRVNSLVVSVSNWLSSTWYWCTLIFYYSNLRKSLKTINCPILLAKNQKYYGISIYYAIVN